MITAQIETIRDTLEEMKLHFPAHHEELALFKDRMPLDPQYHVYLSREDAGQVTLATLREDGVLAGYFVVFVAPGLHYESTLTATADIVYIRPDLRKTGAGLSLFNVMKAALEARGVKLWWVGSKNHKPIEDFFFAFGFTPQERYFAMWLGD